MLQSTVNEIQGEEDLKAFFLPIELKSAVAILNVSFYAKAIIGQYQTGHHLALEHSQSTVWPTSPETEKRIDFRTGTPLRPSSLPNLSQTKKIMRQLVSLCPFRRAFDSSQKWTALATARLTRLKM
jgi:hypothetical protein